MERLYFLSLTSAVVQSLQLEPGNVSLACVEERRGFMLPGYKDKPADGELFPCYDLIMTEP